MLTNKGIPQVTSGSHTIHLYPLGVKNDRILSFVPNPTSGSTSGSCCKGVYYAFSCSLCNITVNLESEVNISSTHTDLIRKEVHAAHNHDDVYSKLLHINDYYIDSKGNGGNAEPVYGKDVKCGMCDETFKLPYQFNRRPVSKQKVNIFEIVGCLNAHYSKCKMISANIDNRKYELESIYAAMQKCVKDNEIPLTANTKPKEQNQIEKNKHIMIKKVGKCHCGISDIVSCVVCGAEWKSYKISYEEYLRSILHHFGKKTSKYDHNDFMILSKELNTMICVICGDDYGISAPKEIVLDHFRMCADKNREYFANRGYKCVN